MIARCYILDNLKKLDRYYLKATTPKESLFYSKLAVIELCGWIEESMDDIIRRCAFRQLKDQVSRNFVEDRIVTRTHSFEYRHNFRQMLIQLLGIVNVVKIEKKLDQKKLAKLKSTLGSLKTVRDTEAHTHIKGTTRRINAPSVTLGQFFPVYEGLVEFELALRKRF